MSEVRSVSAAGTQQPNELEAAFKDAMAFSPSRAGALALSEETLKAKAHEEASFGRIVVDEHGLTGSMQVNLLHPARELMSEWAQVRARFETALQPFRSAIEAVEELYLKIETLKGSEADRIGRVESRAREDGRYADAEREFQIAEQGYRTRSMAAGQRQANMWAYSPIYWVFLLLIGAAEWLINYETFFQFFHVPAMAAGTTIILGLLLAFSAHGHGTILRQWSARFGQENKAGDRWGEYRLLVLSTVAVMIVVGAAGGSRYAWALNALAAMPTQSIIPGIAMPAADPLRDVLLSLLGNVGAWIVGVFIAYLFHDKSPELMSWTRQYQRANARFRRLRARYDDEIQTVRAQIEREIADLTNTASVRSQAVEAQRTQLQQIRQHEDSILEQVLSIIRRNAQMYQNVLSQIVLAGQGAVQVFQGEKPLTPFEYRNLKPALTPDLLAA
jgi:hypothetical protein